MNRARAIWTPIWTPIWNRCLRLFRRLTGPGPDGHPTPELLAAYHEDRLPPEKDVEIQEHFVECAECPELVLDLDRFASKEMPIMASDDLTDVRVDRAWRRLRRQLLKDIVVPRFPRPQLLWLRRPALAWGMVGVLLPCTFGLGMRAENLAANLRAMEAPQVNPPVAMVEVPPVVRSAAKMRAEFEVPPGAPRFLLVVEPPNKAELTRGRLEIQSEQGEGIRTVEGLTLNEDGLFVVGFSPAFLPGGDYNIRLLGVDRGGERVVQDYPVRLSYL